MKYVFNLSAISRNLDLWACAFTISHWYRAISCAPKKPMDRCRQAPGISPTWATCRCSTRTACGRATSSGSSGGSLMPSMPGVKTNLKPTSFWRKSSNICHFSILFPGTSAILLSMFDYFFIMFPSFFLFFGGKKCQEIRFVFLVLDVYLVFSLDQGMALQRALSRLEHAALLPLLCPELPQNLLRSCDSTQLLV